MTLRRVIFWGLVALVVVLIGLGMNTSRTTAPGVAPAAPARLVAIDGSDGTGGIIDPVNVWNDYDTRSPVVARVHPGEQVGLIRQVGNGVLIRTSAGSTGWVSKDFIKELR